MFLLGVQGTFVLSVPPPLFNFVLFICLVLGDTDLFGLLQTSESCGFLNSYFQKTGEGLPDDKALRLHVPN